MRRFAQWVSLELSSQGATMCVSRKTRFENLAHRRMTSCGRRSHLGRRLGRPSGLWRLSWKSTVAGGPTRARGRDRTRTTPGLAHLARCEEFAFRPRRCRLRQQTISHARCELPFGTDPPPRRHVIERWRLRSLRRGRGRRQCRGLGAVGRGGRVGDRRGEARRARSK